MAPEHDAAVSRQMSPELCISTALHDRQEGAGNAG